MQHDSLQLPRGPIMADISGLTLTQEEKERLCHPTVGSVILFSRNYESTEQLQALTAEIHDLRTPPLLISVDHEGGRVQRFRQGFTQLPAMHCYGEMFDNDPAEALQQCATAGWLMAAELLELGVDFSFAPIADLETGVSDVIGDRAFHSQPGIAAELALSFMLGMRKAGMAATAKHFPGHGSVQGDSHHMIPVDERSFQQLSDNDLVPFRVMIASAVEGIMTAHVIYPQMDDQPPTFSNYWLKQVLRKELGYTGLIFSDDLSMAGAKMAGGPYARAKAAMDAGCDVILVCNDTPALNEVIDGLSANPLVLPGARLDAFAPKIQMATDLKQSADWQQAVHSVMEIA
ncbi:MAG: beta-N-acetylhexosaminidase [Arenicellales bacterium]